VTARSSVRRKLRRAGLRILAEGVAFHRRVTVGRRLVAAEDVATLRSTIQRLPALAAAASGAEAKWLPYRHQFRHEALSRDPRRFLRWPVLRPMYKRDAPYLVSWLRYLRAHHDWSTRWLPALQESPVGDPRPFFEDRTTSGNLLKQAYHVCRFEDVTGARLSDLDLIFEFGAGYGALCRLTFALGFQGTYVLFDFPEFSALQQFYLRAHGLPTASEPRLTSDRRVAVPLSTLGELDGLLASRPWGRAGFVALWSLSETPLALREAILTRLAPFDAFLLGYQPSFADIDNPAWFAQARARLDVEWHDVPLEPTPQSGRHLFGIRRTVTAAETTRGAGAPDLSAGGA
jgi:hypothetical protein